MEEGLNPSIEYDPIYGNTKLDSLEYIALKAKLKFDEVSLYQETTMKYDGEFGKELIAQYDLDGLKETIHLVGDQLLNNLELGYLKMHALREDLYLSPALSDMDITIQIESENINLETFQQNFVTCRFKRNKEEIMIKAKKRR